MKQSTGFFLAGSMFMVAGVIGLSAGNAMFLAFLGLSAAFLALGYRAGRTD